jgi:hypothetical protein
MLHLNHLIRSYTFDAINPFGSLLDSVTIIFLGSLRLGVTIKSYGSFNPNGVIVGYDSLIVVVAIIIADSLLGVWDYPFLWLASLLW